MDKGQKYQLLALANGVKIDWNGITVPEDTQEEE